MRYLFGFICVLALGLMGCSETAGTGGSGGDAGSGGGGGEGGQGGVGGGTVACADNVCPCTEAGIRAAIAEGGGPFTFDCDGATTVVSQAPIEIDNDVILNGAGEVTVDGDNDHHVFTVPEGVTAELQGFTVTNGVDDPSISGAGGIRTSGTLMLINCTVSGNTGRWMAGIGNGGTLTLNNSTVSDNTGIGIYNAGPGTLTLNNSTVSGNDGNGIAGDGNTTLIDSTVSGNSAISGGGIDATGGPMSFSSGPLTLINSTVSGNTAEQGGGGIVGGEPTTLRNSTVSGNTAAYGGGIVFGIDVMLINSTVSGNTALGDGGGILAVDSLTLINSTVSGNTAVRGSAIYDSAVEAAGTVIDGTCGRPGPTTSNGHNIESPGDTCGFDPDGTDLVNVTEGDLNLGPLQANDGPTETHALLPGSVAIDQIPAEDCEETADQRGEPRPETGGDACDIGAFERQPDDPEP